MFDENSNATAAATLVGPAGTNTALHTANLNSTHLFNQLLNVKDSRWLQLEVCREFQRGQCSRSDVDCKFAHPGSNVDVQNGRVTACYDSIKGRCTREKCKYLHPPQHLKDQLLINGRNNLAIKNLICSQLTQPNPLANNIQLAQLMQQNQPVPTLPYHQYYSTPLIYPLMPTADFQTLSPVAQQLALLQNQQKQQQQQTQLANPLANASSVLVAAQLAAQQQQNAAALQSQLYAASSNVTSPPLNTQQLASIQLQQQLASQQQAALLAALTSQQTAQQAAQASVTNVLADSRKRTARVAGLEEAVEEKKSAMATSSSVASIPTGILPATAIAATNGQQAGTTALDALSLQQQLLLLNASATATAGNGIPNGKRLDKNGLPANGHAIPIYAAQQPAGPNFGPYIGYAPVSYSGQLPPRF